MTDGKVNIHGKEYETVASRVQRFREKHGNEFALTTEIVHRDEDVVVMKATISAYDGGALATGYAEESRTSSQINRTSALENAETSAIGRALAAFGMAGTEYASADEVAQAIGQRNASKPAQKPAVGSASNDQAIKTLTGDTPATRVQKARIAALLRGKHVLDDDMPTYLEKQFGVIPGETLLSKDADNIIKELS